MPKLFQYLYLPVTLIFLLFYASPVFAATSTLTTLSTNAAQIGRYQKFEITFQINKTYSNTTDNQAADYYLLPYYFYDSSDTPASDPSRTSPYGVNGISIDAHFTSPTGKSLTAPAFYYQDYARSGSVSRETMTPTANYSWKVRFAPEELGDYSYYITITDKEGITTSATNTFSSVASSSHGFIRASAKDTRFLAYEDGTPFVPVGSGGQWMDNVGRSYYYENEFNQFGQNGINFLRIWDQNDGFNLTVEGPYDFYGTSADTAKPSDSTVATIPKGSQMNQRGNYEEDKIIEAAERNNVHLQLCSHGDAYWIWDGSTINESWNTTKQAVDSPRHLGYWKRNFRYRVARWGYSTSVIGWEFANEEGQIPPTITDSNNKSNPNPNYVFHQNYGAYQKSTDPYNHIRTTSLNSQAFSPGIWSSAAMDLANYHDYMDYRSGTYTQKFNNVVLSDDEVLFIDRFSWCLTDSEKNPSSPYCSNLGLGDGSSWNGVTKPWVWGEIGIWKGGTTPMQSGEAGKRFVHNIVWAGLFSPMGTTPLDWYQNLEDSATTTEKMNSRNAAAKFFSTVNFDGGVFTRLLTAADTPSGYSLDTISTSNSQFRVLGMRSSDKNYAYLWIQNRDNIWSKDTTTPSPATGTVTLNNLNNQTYKIEIWNTSTGQITSSTTTPAISPSVTIQINNLVTDVAVKIESTSIPTSTLVPSKPITSTPPSGKSGDANGDSKVDGLDYVIWLNNFGTISTAKGATVGDFNSDGKVDGLDYVIWLNNFGVA